MLHRSFKPAKCKTSLKLATSRLKLMRNKKDNHLKQLKRELAQLLESGQDQTALIQVEHVVREEKTIAAYELVDIYCELIVARLPIIDSQKNCPIDLKEAVTSVVFATPRCSDIPELQDVRKHFTAKYGKEFVNAALELRPDSGVSRMLVEKLSANAPDGQTKLKILSAIAEEHNVEWDPKSFGEKESKPYEDILKGPNAFDSASKMQSEPPIVQTFLPPPPPPDFPAPDDQYDPRGHLQQNLDSSSSRNLASSDFSGAQSAASTAPHPPVRSSGAEYEEAEIRHSHPEDQNSLSLGGQSWNMEFKDAAAAAQAAAESAERASMAARAAAELASRGKFISQQSDESRKSNDDGLRADRPRTNHDSSSEDFVNDVDFSSPQDGNRKLSTRTERVDEYVHERHLNADERFNKDDHGTVETYSQAASSRFGTASSFVDDRRPVNNYHEVDRYSRNSPFLEEAAELENNTSFSSSRARKQSYEEDCNGYSYSSFSKNGDNHKKPSSHQNFVFDNSKDSFDNGISSLGSVNNGTSGPVFDSYLDDDVIKFDKQPQYDEHGSRFYSTSSTREPSNNFSVHIDKGNCWDKTSSASEKPLSVYRVSDDLFSVPRIDETSPKAPSSVYPNDLPPPIFDDCPISDIEDELEKASFLGKPEAGISSHKDTDVFRKSNYLNEDHGLKKGAYFTEKDDSGSSRKQSLLDSSEDSKCTKVTGQYKHRNEFGSQSQPRFDDYEVPSPRSSSANRSFKISSNEMARGLPPQSSNSSVNEVFDQSGQESEKELKYSTLTGGLRNKGYKTPPYTKSPSGDSSASKGATEDSSAYTRNNGLGKDDFEGELPQQNRRSKREVSKENSSARTGPNRYNLGMEEEIPKPKLVNKQERKEDYTKSKFSAPTGYFGPDSEDSDEDIPKKTVTSTGRAGSVFSRRTKTNPDSETNSHSKEKHGPADVKPTSVPGNKPDVTRRSESRPAPEETQKPLSTEQLSSPLKAATSSGEAPSRESSFKKANHVHPKLPDYDSIAAHMQSFRPNRD